MKNIKQIIKEEINDFDWIEEHEFTHKEVIQHIKDNNITEWTFGEHWDGDLDLYETKITSLGNLQSVGGYLDLYGSKITSLDNLESVGGDLYLHGTPISKTHSEEQIRQMVQVDGRIYM